jgi:para-aminobenzoate synthetase component 2
MILMIDNYDSFTYNLVHYLKSLDRQVQVIRNDAITLAAIEVLQPEIIVISPGPCTPNEAGMTLEIITHFKGRIPILGICLGHQAIAVAFGGAVVKAPQPVHGKLDFIVHDNKGVFKNLENPLQVTRYHSLVVSEIALPEALTVSATSPDGLIMGIRHNVYPIEGVQFHPEAILTQQGHDLLNNFIKVAEAFWACR